MALGIGKKRETAKERLSAMDCRADPAGRRRKEKKERSTTKLMRKEGEVRLRHAYNTAEDQRDRWRIRRGGEKKKKKRSVFHLPSLKGGEAADLHRNTKRKRRRERKSRRCSSASSEKEEPLSQAASCTDEKEEKHEPHPCCRAEARRGGRGKEKEFGSLLGGTEKGFPRRGGVWRKREDGLAEVPASVTREGRKRKGKRGSSRPVSLKKAAPTV